jgi:predicted ATPase/DNA-binding CsgD family transcriptional regulator
MVHGLVPALTSFVGRETAAAEVAALLGDYRLVTVTGPGGVGKTRLAGEVARRVAGQFADGAWLTELARVHDQALVPAAVAVALGVREAPGTGLVESMAAVLSRRQLLLILDNCEHVLAAAAELCLKLLPFADDVRILATSRELLGVAGEARYRLAPLSLPGPAEIAGIAHAEAVRLFADRARQADRRFTLSPESGQVAAKIVRRLDGIPLAIELAAARVEALGLEQLADCLDDRLLTTGNQLAPDRHRSLAAIAEWSYRLLGEQERAAFRRLAVFPGPFTLEAAQEVAGIDAGPAVLRLVDCSLLAPPHTGRDGRARYLMLGTLRAYAGRRLAQAGEEPRASAAQAGYAVRVAERAAAALETSDAELAAAAWLDAEDPTMQRGLAWALEHDPARALRLAVALAPWWSLRGRYVAGYELLSAASRHVTPGSEEWCGAQVWLGRLATGADEAAGYKHFAAARDALAARTPTLMLVQALAGCADCLLNLGRVSEAGEQAQRAMELATELGYPEGEARALGWLGASSYYAGDLAAALAWWRQAQRIDPAVIPGSVLRRTAIFLAIALFDAAELAEAGEHCGRALSLARAAGAVFDQADGLILMANIDLVMGRVAEGRAHLREAMDLTARIGNDLLVHDCLDTCGHLCAGTGRYAEAITVWAADAALRRRAGIPDPPRDAQRREKPLRTARQALGAERASAAQARGAAMTLSIAVEYAALAGGEDTDRPPAEPGTLQLSAREQELVTLVAQGRTNAQIAEQLYISANTVRSHLDRIRDKTGCRRRADLTRLALQGGLV